MKRKWCREVYRVIGIGADTAEGNEYKEIVEDFGLVVFGSGSR